MNIFYDVDTQKDFMNKDGALSIPNAEGIKPNLRALTEFAKIHGIKIQGSVDRHFGTKEWKSYELELSRWAGPFPDHCMDGTEGQKKIPETSTDAIFIENYSPSEEVKCFNPHDLELVANSGRAIIFEKQSYSVFPTGECPGGNKYVEQFLKYIGVTDAVMYGVATDYCVKAAALDMKARGTNVVVVFDAIEAVNASPDDGKNALEEMCRAGVKLRSTADILENRVDELKIGVVGYYAMQFDAADAIVLLQDEFNKIDKKYPRIPKAVVAGLTDKGIHCYAYREARNRVWRTVGVGCSKASSYDCFPVDEKIIVGREWGDESFTFLNSIDVLVRIGGGEQAIRETADMKARGKPVIEHNLD